MGIPNREAVEGMIMVGGLVGVQFLYAGNSVVQSYLMLLGFQPSSLIILSTFATFLVLAPLSFLLERHQWPKRLSMKLWIQLLLISFGGVTLFQSLQMKGIHLTSPAIATAMPNLAPGLIFFLAWAFRLEKVHLSSMYSRAKIAGTIFCVMGAALMTLMQGDYDHHHILTSSSFSTMQSHFSTSSCDNFAKITGSVYLITGVFTLSSVVVLQAATLGDFPSPITISAITSLMGMLFTVIVQLIQEHRVEIGLSKTSIQNLLGFSLLAGCISGASTSFNAWAMKKRGPVMVAVFGMFLMFTGLYFVLWAKGNEVFDHYHNDYDLEKSLLT
ncbi:hypothetical protein DM860_001823 [Cuscuta australis]|uniref:WAT1-related protein n=1 Tax=Cuscuta australis TaxID=267555 RepID=A0A328E9G0_9ASTE|nr:hypothetical protein DM860_001823 [Cuscuta australis]